MRCVKLIDVTGKVHLVSIFMLKHKMDISNVANEYHLVKIKFIAVCFTVMMGCENIEQPEQVFRVKTVQVINDKHKSFALICRFYSFYKVLNNNGNGIVFPDRTLLC